MRKPILAVLGLATLAVSATPALAVPSCDSQDSVTMSIEIDINGHRRSDEADQMRIYQMLLNQQGVPATRVEKWNGCLRAFVTQPGGGEIMQFFDPSTLRQVF
jgi:hypothetical protein